METIKDILREMRGCAGYQERMGFYDLRNLATETLRVFADRIEAAAKREFGNAAKMREVVDEIRVAAMSDYVWDADYLIEKCNAALVEPPRNCDVGTEQEQQDRFREFCRHYESEGECGIGRSKAACPAFQGGRNPDCSLWWAHMPFAEGGAK